jgi:glycosyltransferase involved in cell wall biosynthesis
MRFQKLEKTASDLDWKIDLSIVIPVMNEEESILELYSSIKNICDGLALQYEIVFIDDGSQDKTFRLLTEMQLKDQRIRIIKFRKNYGQTSAMAAGFELARGKIIVSMDGDLQNDPSDIPRLLDKIEEGYDVVCGWRKRRQDKFWSRLLPSMIANWIISSVTGVKIHDNGCSLRAFRGSVIKNVTLYNEMHRFIPAMSTLTGARISEIVVNHHPRHFGKSKYGIGRTWRVVLDIITVKMIISFSSRPALWFGFLSVPFTLLAFIAVFLGMGMFLGEQIDGWLILSTVSFLLLSLSAHLFAMGIIGELSVKMGDNWPERGIKPTMVVQ